MATRPLPIKLYLALQGRAPGTPPPAANWPPCPDGQVIWAICGDGADAQNAATLETALRADGDAVSVIRSLPADTDAGALITPDTLAGAAALLDHFTPAIALVIGAPLDPVLLDPLHARDIPVFVLEATAEIAALTDAAHIPRLTRAALRLCDQIIAVDAASAAALGGKGAETNRMLTLGAMVAAPPPLPYSEDERNDLARALGTRPIWLAAGARLDETEVIATAHHQASRRAHRLLLIVATDDPADAAPMATLLRGKGFNVATRAEDSEPGEATQIFVADGPDELGLWYRIAPISYLAGTLSTGARRHPFEPAALGSAVLHGPHVTPYEQQIAQLARQNGSLPVAHAAGLGEAVETLLSADKVARMAHAAWDVTTQGADVARQVATLIQTRLDQDSGG